ncbi:hypothetical protein ABW19_dt0208012 [Dactylella cylindrospora]|nr:hypothetical protein ABW19_dt0208012 [Dactylella cylindrospora]
MVKIQLVSDLHLEAPSAYDTFALETAAPYLALLGDIGNVRDDGYFDFLRRLLKQYEIIFFVAGNHEPYHSDWSAANARLCAFATSVNDEASYGRFVVLNQTRYDVTSSFTILGCILFSAIDPVHKDDVSFGLNDFYYIKDWTVENHTTGHTSDVMWLNSEVQRIMDQEPQRRIAIFTHYCPTFEANDPKYRSSKISSGFTTGMANEVCWTSSNVSVWAFGHTHFNCDYLDKETGKRILANQRGYYFSQAAGFDPIKVLEVDEGS